MLFLLAQIIGFIAFIFQLIAYHKQKKKQILQNMLISNGLNLIHYLLLKAYSGLLTKIIAIIRDLIIIMKNKYKLLSTNLILYFLITAYILIGILSYSNIWSIFPVLSAIIYTIPLWNGNELTTKKAAFISRFFWLIYNIAVLSISGIVSDITFLISTFIAIMQDKTNNLVKN